MGRGRGRGTLSWYVSDQQWVCSLSRKWVDAKAGRAWINPEVLCKEVVEVIG